MKTIVLPNSTIALLNGFAAEQRGRTINWLRSQLGLSRSDAEDVFQDSFLVLYENLSMKDMASMYGYKSPESVKVMKSRCQLDSVALRRQQLEELALLRGKIEMGLDIEASTRKLQAIFDAACADSISPYKPFLYDMAFTLMEGYDKTGNDVASREVLDALGKWDDGLLMSDK